MNSYNVNHLLTTSRFAERFYPDLYNLSERDSIYQNPGVSVRSYLLAHALRNETVNVPDELVEEITLCENLMNTDSYICIMKLLTVKVEELITAFNGRHLKIQSKYKEDLMDLLELIKKCKEEISSGDKSFLKTVHGNETCFMRDALYKLQDKIQYLNGVIIG